ncbi:hypothetical protein COCCADRAFT_10665 [Bipolaris zeicola 26-R-13]|uniref:Uncharacterized protein n=1 Tax=Cochliobolus carbonum (strain 26-R-13) TaxID=930089 RepID=W6XM08_COCC2|nr:uncharacterized protein COCCADRAFT_10665 [Bipolaris zeicola 26-R-13]EUC26593.1 hypothetical protein COCCADRAFT_10665 [Bipolaris zeicola 26-R-13]
MRFLFGILMLSIGSALADSTGSNLLLIRGITRRLLLVVEGATTIVIQTIPVALNVMIVIAGAKLYSVIVSKIGNS